MPKPPNPNSPTAWLWAEIAKRFGQEQAEALHEDYLAEARVYGKRRRHDVPTPNVQNGRPRIRAPRRRT